MTITGENFGDPCLVELTEVAKEGPKMQVTAHVENPGLVRLRTPVDMEPGTHTFDLTITCFEGNQKALCSSRAILLVPEAQSGIEPPPGPPGDLDEQPDRLGR